MFKAMISAMSTYVYINTYVETVKRIHNSNNDLLCSRFARLTHILVNYVRQFTRYKGLIILVNNKHIIY